MTPEQERAEARKALDAATQGTWTCDPFISGYGIKAGNYHNQIALITENSGINRDREQAKNNATFIVNAPTWLRNSLDREEQLIAEVAEWKEKAFAERDKEMQRLRKKLIDLKQLIPNATYEHNFDQS